MSDLGLATGAINLGADILDVGALSKRDMEVVTVDIRVQKKLLWFPSDAT